VREQISLTEEQGEYDELVKGADNLLGDIKKGKVPKGDPEKWTRADVYKEMEKRQKRWEKERKAAEEKRKEEERKKEEWRKKLEKERQERLRKYQGDRYKNQTWNDVGGKKDPYGMTDQSYQQALIVAAGSRHAIDGFDSGVSDVGAVVMHQAQARAYQSAKNHRKKGSCGPMKV